MVVLKDLAALALSIVAGSTGLARLLMKPLLLFGLLLISCALVLVSGSTVRISSIDHL